MTAQIGLHTMPRFSDHLAVGAAALPLAYERTSLPPENSRAPDLPAGDLAGSLASFFDLSGALSLSEAENRALLDTPEDAVTALRAGTADLVSLDPRKLQRRLDYAIPILQRMLVSMTS